MVEFVDVLMYYFFFALVTCYFQAQLPIIHDLGEAVMAYSGMMMVALSSGTEYAYLESSLGLFPWFDNASL